MKATDSNQRSSTAENLMVTALEQLLRAQLEGHQQLLDCVGRQRDAIRTADMGRITTICGEENAIIQRIAEIEKHRLELIGRMTQATNPRADKPLTVSEIALAAQEPQRTRLAALSAQLRDALVRLRQESSIVRTAAETLNRHMGGIVQTVHSALSRARVYGNRGTIALGASLQTVVDIKS